MIPLLHPSLLLLITLKHSSPVSTSSSLLYINLSLSSALPTHTIIKMKFFAVAALFAGVFAMPAELEQRTEVDVCPDGLFSNPICCATDVLGLACLDGEVRK
jgi:hypothetical protein